jgi:histone acetyltransferase MYST1
MDEWVLLDKVDLITGVVGISSELDEQSGPRKRSHSKIKNSELPVQSKENALIALEKEHDEITKVKNIHSIVLGKYEMETWYYAPYPDDYCCDDKMFICEFCLKYMKKHKRLEEHCLVCKMRSPPGKEIYHEEGLSMYELDGKDHKIYCQNLCLLSKLFLDHKVSIKYIYTYIYIYSWSISSVKYM